MADNTTLNGGTGGDVIATDDIAGVKHQRVKVQFGADGSATDVSSGAPLPVSGTVALDSASLAALETISIAGSVAVTGSFFQATQPVSGTLALDAGTLAALETINIGNTVPVTGTFFQATQPVSGTVALDAGTLAALETISIAGTVPVSGPLTDTQLRATSVPISIDQTTPGTTNGTQITALSYPQSTANNSTAQLAASATFTGGIETVLSLQAAQIMVTSDQPYTVFIDQFIDLAGTKLVATYTFTRLAGVPLNENVTLPGNYMRVRVQNTGASTTTTFRLDTTFGIMNTQPNTLSNLGNLRVVAQENGVVSTVNSTTTNLAAAAVFTGTAEDVSEFSMIMVSVFSSHVSATDGLSVEQSSDGTNWDITDVYTIPATTGKTFSFAVVAKFYRLRYTNGGTLTTSLRIQTLFSRTAKKASSVRPQDARPNDNDFEEALSYLMLYNGTTWDRARGDATNGARVQNTPVVSATTISAANTTVTLTIPAAGAGLFTYLTRIRITNHNTSAAAVAASAVTLAYTSTNIPTGLAWTEGNALAAGTSKTVVDESMANPIKTTTANTATTIVAPAAGAGVLVRITAYYYTGP